MELINIGGKLIVIHNFIGGTMKNLFALYSAILLLIIFCSCKKSSDSTSPQNPKYVIKANISGKEVIFNNVTPGFSIYGSGGVGYVCFSHPDPFPNWLGKEYYIFAKTTNDTLGIRISKLETNSNGKSNSSVKISTPNYFSPNTYLWSDSVAILASYYSSNGRFYSYYKVTNCDSSWSFYSYDNSNYIKIDKPHTSEFQGTDTGISGSFSFVLVKGGWRINVTGQMLYQ